MQGGPYNNYNPNPTRPNVENIMAGEFDVWVPTSTSKDSDIAVGYGRGETSSAAGSWGMSDNTQMQNSRFSDVRNSNVVQNQSFEQFSQQRPGNEQYTPYTSHQPQQQVHTNSDHYEVLPRGNIFYDSKDPYGLAGVTQSDNIPGSSTGPPSNIPNTTQLLSNDMHRYNPNNYTYGLNSLKPEYNNQTERNVPPFMNWNEFQNPLNRNLEENDESTETIVARMKKAADEAPKHNARKPTGLSNAALACVQKELQNAAKPFQSPESLKRFRDLNLGIATDSDDASVIETVTDVSSASSLSVSAPEFVPRKIISQVKLTSDVPVKQNEQATLIEESEVATISLNLIDDCINQLICNPACSDVLVPTVIQQLQAYNLSPSAVSILVDKIYEMCVVEQNFRYLGSQFCDKLSRTNTGLPKFRTILLSKAQREFNIMDDLLRGPNTISRALGFTQFIAELFLHLMCETNDSLARFSVLGRGLLGVVRKLIDNPNDDNLQCTVRVLKLTIISLEESLKDDKKDSLKKLETILNDLEVFAQRKSFQNVIFNDLTNQLLDGFVKLRKIDWGRSPAGENRVRSSSPNLPETDENYYMNEPIFFTPKGVQYTAADAADPEFYQQHLAPHTMQQNASQAPEDSYGQPVNDMYSQNPLTEMPVYSRMPYTNWSAGEPDTYDQHSAEDISNQDDYDSEFEAFLRNSGQ